MLFECFQVATLVPKTAVPPIGTWHWDPKASVQILRLHMACCVVQTVPQFWWMKLYYFSSFFLAPFSRCLHCMTAAWNCLKAELQWVHLHDISISHLKPACCFLIQTSGWPKLPSVYSPKKRRKMTSECSEWLHSKYSDHFTPPTHRFTSLLDMFLLYI